MQHLAVVEEDLRGLSAESISKRRQNHSYPEIKDAAENALNCLKLIREEYVKGRGKAKENGDRNSAPLKYPVASKKGSGLPQSSDILAPYILACNYAEGSTKLLTTALNGVHNLIIFEMIPPNDVKNILRVLSIQAGSNNSNSGNSTSASSTQRLQPDSQLKILQISLKLLNFLSTDSTFSVHLTEHTICSFLSLTFQFCDQMNNISVSSAALITARQMITLIFEGASRNWHASHEEADNLVDYRLSLGAITLFKELCMLAQGQSGEFLGGGAQRGALFLQQHSLDLLGDVLYDWTSLFLHCERFRSTLPLCVAAVNPLVRTLSHDFALIALKQSVGSGSGHAAAVMHCNLILRIARFLLLQGLLIPQLLGSLEALLCAVVHCLQPPERERRRKSGEKESFNAHPGTPPSVYSTAPNAASVSGTAGDSDSVSLRSRLEEASSFMARLGLSATVKKDPPSTPSSSSSVTSPPVGAGAPVGSAYGFFIPLRTAHPPPSLQSAGGEISPLLMMLPGTFNSSQQQLPSHPAAACLELLLAVCTHPNLLILSENEKGLRFLELLLVNSGLCTALFLHAALKIDSNCRLASLVIVSIE